MIDDGEFGMLPQTFGKTVEKDLLIDGKFVDDYEDVRVFSGRQIGHEEAFPVFGENDTFVHQDAVSLLDRFPGYVQFGGQLVHGRKHLLGKQGPFSHAAFNLCH